MSDTNYNAGFRKIWDYLAGDVLGKTDGSQYGNADGKVEKSEFFMATLNLTNWDGTDQLNDKKDIINQFWAKFDTEIEGKIAGTGLNDKNAFNKTEINNIQDDAEDYKLLMDYIKNLQSNVIVDEISVLGKEGNNNYLAKVFELINAGLIALWDNGGIDSEDDITNWVNANLETIKLNAVKDIAFDSVVDTVDNLLKAVCDHKGHDYSLLDCADFVELKDSAVQNYLEAQGNNATAEGLAQAIFDACAEYLAKAAIALTNDNGKLNAEMQHMGEVSIENEEVGEFNDLQSKRLENELVPALLSNYESLGSVITEEIRSIIENHINALKDTTTFSALMNMNAITDSAVLEKINTIIKEKAYPAIVAQMGELLLKEGYDLAACEDLEAFVNTKLGDISNIQNGLEFYSKIEGAVKEYLELAGIELIEGADGKNEAKILYGNDIEKQTFEDGQAITYTDLQKQRLQNDLPEDLYKNIYDNYESIKGDILAVIKDWVDFQMENSAKTFAELFNSTEIDGDYKTKIDNLISVYENYSDIKTTEELNNDEEPLNNTPSEDLTESLVYNFGAEVANIIAKNDQKEGGVYQRIYNDIYNTVKNENGYFLQDSGMVNNGKIINHIIDSLKDHFLELLKDEEIKADLVNALHNTFNNDKNFYTFLNDYGIDINKMTPEEIYEIFEIMISQLEDVEKVRSNARDLIIKHFGDSSKVTEKLGADFWTHFNSLSTISDIKKCVRQVLKLETDEPLWNGGVKFDPNTLLQSIELVKWNEEPIELKRTERGVLFDFKAGTIQYPNSRNMSIPQQQEYLEYLNNLTIKWDIAKINGLSPELKNSINIDNNGKVTGALPTGSLINENLTFEVVCTINGQEYKHKFTIGPKFIKGLEEDSDERDVVDPGFYHSSGETGGGGISGGFGDPDGALVYPDAIIDPNANPFDDWMDSTKPGLRGNDMSEGLDNDYTRPIYRQQP